MEKNIFTSHTVQGAINFGQSIYTNRSKLEAWQDNNAAPLYSDRTVYFQNYRIGWSPQLVMGLGYKYSGKKFWHVGIYFNYFDQIYIEPNPDRRTAEAVSNYLSNEGALYHKIIDQQKLPSYYTANFNGGKSFRVFGKYFLNVNLSVNNLINNQNILVSGFEQLRWDPANVAQFANKYYYMTGTTYVLMLNMNL